MEFRILGPVELWSGGHRVDVGWARERAALAILLMTPGQPVPVDTLVEHLWDSNAPAKAKDLLYPHVTRLRKRLQQLGEEVSLRSAGGAYALDVDPETIDLHRFRRLTAQARSMAESGDDEHAVQLHREAAALWRATPLTGIDGTWAARQRRAIEDELLAGTVGRIELELRRGDHAALIGELSELVAKFPYDEKLLELLMLAQFRSGRQAEALNTYQEARRRLAEELGTDPAPGPRELHQRILNRDPGLAFQPPRSAKALNNLPPDPRAFTGRERELAQATADVSAITVLSLDGMPGIGKTVLAVRFARLLADHYPDGQILLDLCGHSAAQPPLDARTALDRLLRNIGLPANRIPAALEDKAAVWRAELARRRMIFILDDAVAHEQIELLLPGQSECLAIVTGRRRLAGLDDVRPISLDVLSPEDAAALFVRIVGQERTQDAEQVAEVVGKCGYVPLAIQLVGNRLRHRQTWSVADLAARLTGGNAGDRLSEIRAGNRELIDVFDLSYRDLNEAERRAFRLLGLHPGSDFSARCAAALLDTDPRMTERLLDALVDWHLLAELRHGRYRFHDLLGEYARMLARRDSQSVHDAALDRLLDHFLACTAKADRFLYPHRPRLGFGSPEAAPIDSPAEARRWLAEEQDNLVQVIQHATDQGRAVVAARLAHLTAPFFEESGRWQDAARLHEEALGVWRRLGDLRAAAAAHVDLGTVLRRSGHHPQALQHTGEALRLLRDLDDRPGTAETLDEIGQIHWQLSEFDVAAGYLEQALAIRDSLGDKRGCAETLDHLAIVHWYRGDHRGATDRFRQALALYQEVGDTRGALMTINNQGEVAFSTGDYESALDYYEKAAPIAEVGRQYHATWRNNVARVQQHTGQTDEALKNYRLALFEYRDIGDRLGEADTLANIGFCYLDSGRDNEGLIHLRKAQTLAEEIGERHIQTETLRGIGQALARSGRHPVAMEHYQQALALCRTIGDTLQEARVLEAMGTLSNQTGQPKQAREYLTRALQIYTDLDVPDAAPLKAQISPRRDVSG